MLARPRLAVVALASLTLPSCIAEPALEWAEGSPLVESNGTTLNGRLRNGLVLNGRLRNGFVLNGRLRNGQRLNGLSLSGSRLLAIVDDGSRVEDLVGATFDAIADDGSTVPLRIVAVREEPVGSTIWQYEVVRVTDAGDEPLCTDAAGNAVAAIPLEGSWDMREGAPARAPGTNGPDDPGDVGGGAHVDDPDVMTLACRGYALAKCVELGYQPWGPDACGLVYAPGYSDPLVWTTSLCGPTPSLYSAATGCYFRDPVTPSYWHNPSTGYTYDQGAWIQGTQFLREQCGPGRVITEVTGPDPFSLDLDVVHPDLFVPYRDYHQACTRLVRADYCSDGSPHTQDGTAIDVFDVTNVQVDDPSTAWAFEAAWSPGGAVWMGESRYVDDAPGCAPSSVDGATGELPFATSSVAGGGVRWNGAILADQTSVTFGTFRVSLFPILYTPDALQVQARARTQGGAEVATAGLFVELTRDGTVVATLPATTNGNGQATVQLPAPATGVYRARVSDATHAIAEWDGLRSETDPLSVERVAITSIGYTTGTTAISIALRTTAGQAALGATLGLDVYRNGVPVVLNARVPIGAGGVATATVSKQRGTYRVVVREIVPAPGGVISWDGQTPTNSFRN